MNAGDIAKIVLVAAIVIVLLNLGSSWWRPSGAPRPFDGEWFDERAGGGRGEGYEDTGYGDEEFDDDDDDADEGFDDDDDDDEGFAEIDADFAVARARGGDKGLMATSADLLPPPVNKPEFKITNSLLSQNFLDCSRFVGVDTQGSSLRNANHDLRSAPVTPRKDVGPWSQSTVEADLLRKPLE